MKRIPVHGIYGVEHDGVTLGYVRRDSERMYSIAVLQAYYYNTMPKRGASFEEAKARVIELAREKYLMLKKVFEQEV